MEGKHEDSEGPLPLGVTLNGGMPSEKINPAVQVKITREADLDLQCLTCFHFTIAKFAAYCLLGLPLAYDRDADICGEWQTCW